MHIRSVFLSLVLVFVAALTNAHAKAPQRVKPHRGFLRTYLAGARLSLRQKDFAEFDAKSGYYLIKLGDTFDARGATLILTPDLKWGGWPSDSTVAKQGIIRKTLPHLKTGWGVNIGDKPLQVQRKLGARPHEIKRSNGKIRFYGYHSRVLADMPYATGQWANGQRIVDLHGPTTKYLFYYNASYWFNNGRLSVIEYAVSANIE